MAQRFNLTAQLQLQANSSNINQVVSQLKKQLAPLGNVQLNVQANTKSLAQANQQMATFNANAKTAAGSMGDFNRSLAESARRFSVITVATGSLLSLVNAFKKSTSAAIDFEYEMVKISQTTGQTMREVGAMSNEIRKLSTSLGVSSAELAGTARILLQAGLSADKTRKSLDILAKTTLSASFDDLQSTTEGAIALINQFRGEAARAGGDVKFLEQSLDSINAVSKAFAVESADLVDVIRKVGGVFSNAGGSVNELISLFTSVRATTRESAETIGTGLRTIFTRIQRGDTVDALKELGIELRNSQGQFVGAFEAVKRLSEGLSALDPRDFRFAAVVEELGGYRQIGKVIPLINQFAIAQQALNVAQNASGSVAADAQTSQQALAVQINKTKEKFNEFIATLVDSGSFRSIITGALKLADAFISIGKALEPVLPLLTTLFAIKAGQGLASGIGILRGFAGAPSGIRASKFASGGLVPGSGNRDTVPAMLTPGEFVIRKSSVNKLGAGTLAQMNANGYAKGGQVLFANDGIKVTSTVGKTKGLTIDQAIAAGHKKAAITSAFGKEASDAAFAQRANQQKISTEKEELKDAKQEKTSSKKQVKFKVLPGQIGGFILNPTKGDDGNFVPTDQLLKKEFVLNDGTPAVLDSSAGYPTFYPGGRGVEGKTLKTAAYSRILDAGSKLGLKAGIENAVDLVKNAKLLDVKPAIDTDEDLMRRVSSGLLKDQQVISTVSGYLFEGMIGALSGAIPAGGRAGFDFPRSSIEPNKPKLKSLFDNTGVQNLVKAEAKRNKSQFTGSDGVINKTINDIRKEWASTKGNGPFEGVQKLNKGSSGTGVKPSNYPLVDDILENAKGAILPNPKNIEDIIKAGGGALDVDRTLIRTIGDKAYAQAKTEKAKEEVLKKYFVGAGRLQDIKSSPLTQFGKTLQSAIQSGQINPNNLKIITKSRRVDGVGEYLNQLFGIPLANMIFTQGGSKQPALDAFNTKGSRAQRVVKRASGGGISGSDTVPAMLTPGEFVVSKSAAQSIGYTNLNRMNKHGVQGYASGGVVGFKKFAAGGPTGKGMGLSTVNVGTLDVVMQALVKIGVTSGKTAESTQRYNKAIEAASLALSGGASDAESFDIAFEKLKKSSQNAKDAVEQETKAKDAARKSPTSGNTVAMDERLKSSQNLGGGASTKSFGQAAMINPAVAKELETQQKKEIQAIAREIRSIDANVTAKDALMRAQNVVRNEYGILASEIAKEKQTRKSVISNLTANLGKTGEGVKQTFGTKEGRQAFGQQINAVSGAAQNFVFLGASIAAVASQFSSLDAATQQAITETAGFTSGLVGIGATLIQTFTSMATNSALAATTQMSNTATQQIDTATTQGHSAAVAQDTLQTKSAGAAAAGIANMFAIAAAAVVAVIAGLKFMSSRSKAQADAIEKERKARLANIAETGKSDLPIADLKKSLNEELALREWSASAISTSTMVASGSIALAGAAGGAAIGASLGSAVPVLGTAIGAVVGVIGGLTYAYFNAEAAVNNEVAARQREVDAITKVYEANIQLAETSYKANAALNAIESAPGLQGPEKIKRRLEAQAIGSGIGLQTARKVRPQISEDAASLGITEAQLKALTPDEIRAKGATVEGLGQTQIEGLAARAQVSFETLKMAADQAAAEVQETGKTLNDAIQNLDFSETNAGFESVRLFAEATNAARRAIEIEQQIRLEGAKTKEEEDLVIQQTNNRLSAFDAGIKATESAKRAEEVAIKRAVAAQVAMAEAARKSAIFLNSLADQEDQIQSQSNALKNFTDSLAGNIVDISNSIKPIRNIEDPSKVTDRSRFAREVQAVANASGNPEAAKFANQLTNAANIFARANDTLLGKTLDLGESLNANQVLKDIGLTAETFGGGAAGKKIFDNIAAELTKAAQENPVLTEEALKNILAPLSEQASTAADVINKIQSIQQQELNFRQQQLQAEQAVRDRQLAATEKYNNAIISGAEVLARARGQSVAGARLQAEQQARQRTLNVGQAARGGTFLNATDPKQLASAKRSAEEREAIIRKEINGLQSKTKLEDVEIKRLADLIKIQQQLINTSDDASKALESIASSSSEIDKLTESLDKERGAREQAFGVLKEFVVSGVESRQGLVAASQGILSAIQTGTTQNLPEELRGQVFGLLDKLSNVEIAGTGLTGEQIAKELVARDAIRLGFPPDIALALATQTTTEEKILKELKAQTILMASAARAAAEPPATLSNGGPVYRAAGGSIFKPRGTDTVPAMLTPGEYVVNARSAAKNMSLLKTINASKGGSVRYLKDGSKKPERNENDFVPEMGAWVEIANPKYNGSGLRIGGVDYIEGLANTYGPSINRIGERLGRIGTAEERLRKEEYENKAFFDAMPYTGNYNVGYGEKDVKYVGDQILKSSNLTKYAQMDLKINELAKSLAKTGRYDFELNSSGNVDIDKLMQRVSLEKQFLQKRASIPSLAAGAKPVDVLRKSQDLKKWYDQNLKSLTEADYEDYIPPINGESITFIRSQAERQRVKSFVRAANLQMLREGDDRNFNFSGIDRPTGNLKESSFMDDANNLTGGLSDIFNKTGSYDNDVVATQLLLAAENQKMAKEAIEKAAKEEKYIKNKPIDNRGMMTVGKTNIDPNIVGKATNPNSTLAAAQAGAFIVTQSKIMATEENIANKKLLEDMKKEEAGIAASGGDSMLYRLSQQMNGTSTDKYVQEAIDARKEKIQEQNAETSTASELISKSKTLKDAIQAVDKGFYDYILNFTDVGAKTADGKSIAQEVKNLTSKWQQQALDGGLAKLVSDIYTSSRGKDKVDILFLDPSNFKDASGRLNTDSFRLAQNVARLYNSSRPSDDLAPLNEPENRASGGLVYRAGGGTIFKPRGTDTVPAMLTPGEFVINAKSTRENLPLLQAINNGQQVDATGYQKGGRVIGGVSYLDGGGGIASGQAAIAAVEEKIRQQKFLKIKADYSKKYSELERFGLKYVPDNEASKYSDNFKYLTVKASDPLPKISPTLSEALSNKPELLDGNNAEAWSNILNTTFSNYQNRIALVDKLRSSFEETVYQKINEFMLSAASVYADSPSLETGIESVKTAMLAQKKQLVTDAWDQLGLRNSGFLPINFLENLKLDAYTGQISIALNEARKVKGLKSYEQQEAEKQGSVIRAALVDPAITSISNTISSGILGVGNLVQAGINQGQKSGVFEAAANAKKQQEEKERKEKARKAQAQTRIKQREEDRNARRAARNQNQGLNAANAITLQAQQQQQQQQPQAPLTQEQQFQQQQQQRQQLIAQQQQNLFGGGGGDINVSFGGGRGANTKAGRTLARFNAKLQRYRQRGRPDWEAYYDFFGYIPNNAAEGILNIPGFNFGPTAYYYNKGGSVGGPGGVDKVPAMLTAGEFVMNKQAVQQHGVGYMKSLNKGKVPGFKNGGFVGGVNYLEDGGTARSGGGFSFNFGGLQSIFDSFSGNFQNGLDNIITAFSTIGGTINNLVSALSAGMNVNHQFSGDMTLAFNIQNGDALKTQIAEAITPKLAEIITRELDSRLNNFKAGG